MHPTGFSYNYDCAIIWNRSYFTDKIIRYDLLCYYFSNSSWPGYCYFQSALKKNLFYFCFASMIVPFPAFRKARETPPTPSLTPPKIRETTSAWWV